MKRFFHLMIVAVAAVCMVTGCQKYDDSELRRELQELREKLSSLEAWCSSSQSAIDAVSVLQKAVNDMNSVESIEPFIDSDGATGYVITFTNKQTIKLYNGQNGKDGDAFFGNVVVNDDCIIFTLKDGSTFTVPRKQDDNDYLAFEAVEAGATVSLEIIGEVEAPSLEFSTNKLDWATYDFSNPQTITLEDVGDKVYWRTAGEAKSFTGSTLNDYIHFDLGEKKIAASGNIMSLLDKGCSLTEFPKNARFSRLFFRDTTLVSAPELPATALSSYCYYGMFAYCESLEAAPALPATELPEDCYSCMFVSCSSLTEAPDIPATKVGDGSCYSMFVECSSLKKAPALPAKQLDEFCYQQMFANCTSLEEAPELPATELSKACYSMMFTSCTSLKEAPALPALKMEDQCYFAMFQWCESLETAPELPAMELAEACYANMFLVCPSLKNAPALPATQLDEFCYQQMFAGCGSLEEAPELPATELSIACYSVMFAGCSSLKEAPVLPALKMEEECYYGMFDECNSLETAPKLPATELAEGCYWSMFQECSSLETAPELPAKQLAYACYADMFAYCTSLTEAPELPVKELTEGCYYEMFWECTSLKEAPELPATDLVEECYSGMFNGCSSLNDIKVAFTDWGDGTATAGWVAGVGSAGTFECPEGLEVKYGDDFIPTGWSVNGAVPAAAKSLAAPTSCSSVEKPTIGAKHARRAMLKPELTEPEMIRL